MQDIVKEQIKLKKFCLVIFSFSFAVAIVWWDKKNLRLHLSSNFSKNIQRSSSTYPKWTTYKLLWKMPEFKTNIGQELLINLK